MTTSTAHPGHHFSTRTVPLAFAGALLAAVAGYGVATLVLDEAPTIITPSAPPAEVERGLFPGTDREERALMHRG